MEKVQWLRGFAAWLSLAVRRRTWRRPLPPGQKHGITLSGYDLTQRKSIEGWRSSDLALTTFPPRYRMLLHQLSQARGYRMIARAVPGAPGKLAAESRWAVETRGLTKRFGANCRERC
jgi:hypothetical protein